MNAILHRLYADYLMPSRLPRYDALLAREIGRAHV